MKRKTAIIGGGWAGLAAAVELVSAGVDVTLFEAAKQLGGRARRVEINGQALDNGQHILLGAYRDCLRLMRLVGADPERCFKRLPLAIEHPALGFRLRLPRLPAPLHLAAGLLGARLLAALDTVAKAPADGRGWNQPSPVKACAISAEPCTWPALSRIRLPLACCGNANCAIPVTVSG